MRRLRAIRFITVNARNLPSRDHQKAEILLFGERQAVGVGSIGGHYEIARRPAFLPTIRDGRRHPGPGGLNLRFFLSICGARLCRQHQRINLKWVSRFDENAIAFHPATRMGPFRDRSNASDLTHRHPSSKSADCDWDGESIRIKSYRLAVG